MTAPLHIFHRWADANLRAAQSTCGITTEYVELTLREAAELIEVGQSEKVCPRCAAAVAKLFAGAVPSRCTVYSEVCPEHGFVHGAEAEELRAGIEKILARNYGCDTNELPSGVQMSLAMLLDRTDARDSLAFRDAQDPSRDEAPAAQEGGAT